MSLSTIKIGIQVKIILKYSISVTYFKGTHFNVFSLPSSNNCQSPYDLFLECIFTDVKQGLHITVYGVRRRIVIHKPRESTTVGLNVVTVLSLTQSKCTKVFSVRSYFKT